MYRFASPVLVLVLAGPVLAQDRVTFRDRSAKGPQTASGKIDSESLAGIRIGGRTIPIADVIDVQYDVPGAIKLEYPRAVTAEGRSPAEAVPIYEGLLRNAAVQSNAAIKRHMEYRIAMLTAARGDESADSPPPTVRPPKSRRSAHCSLST
jgi:hypothetical protein